MRIPNAATFGTLLGIGAALEHQPADLGYVKYVGVSNETLGVSSFFGIPYAQPPVGDLRWRAPLPIKTVNQRTPSEYTNATQYALQCVQGPHFYGPTTFDNSLSSEDCLIMNIITPLDPISDFIPVVVDIQGGGCVSGNASSEDGTLLVSYCGGAIIYISIQYRLGAYGFLAGSEVQRDGVLNTGLLDQRLALEWIQDNVHAFGGDSKQVTIVGGSAGGGGVMYQLMREGGESDPPFRSAMPQYAAFPPHHEIATQDAIYAKVVGAANYTSLACLRNLPYEKLAEATQQSYFDAYNAGLYAHGDFGHTPVVDGSFVMDLPSRSLAAGNLTQVPIFNTFDEFEGLGFTNGSLTTETEVLHDLSNLWPAATPSFLSELSALYPLSTYGPAYKAANNIFQSPYFPILALLGEYLGFNISTTNPVFFQNQAIIGDWEMHCTSRNIASAAFNHTPIKIPIWKLRFNAGFFAHATVGQYFLQNPGQPFCPQRYLGGYHEGLVFILCDPSGSEYGVAD